MKNKNKVMDRKIYIFLFKESYFYIGSTIQGLRNVFKSNYLGRNGWTKNYFIMVKHSNVLPQMFLLETITSNSYSCFIRQLAWAKLLIDNDFICINGDKFMQYVESVCEDDADYSVIKNTDLQVLLRDTNSLFQNYGRQRKPNPTQKQLGISLTIEEHNFITAKAKECNMTKKDYVKQLVLNPNIIMLDTSSLEEYIAELRTGISSLRQIIVNVYYMQQYFPSDLKKIQDFTDMVNEHYKAMVILSTDMSKQIIKSRKIKISKNLSSEQANHRA